MSGQNAFKKVIFLSLRSNYLVYLCAGCGQVWDHFCSSQGARLGCYSIPPQVTVRCREKGFLLVQWAWQAKPLGVVGFWGGFGVNWSFLVYFINTVAVRVNLSYLNPWCFSFVPPILISNPLQREEKVGEQGSGMLRWFGES